MSKLSTPARADRPQGMNGQLERQSLSTTPRRSPRNRSAAQRLSDIGQIRNTHSSSETSNQEPEGSYTTQERQKEALGCQTIQDPHAHVVSGAKQIVVDPADCFPLARTRDQYGTAVDYFAFQFQRLVLAGLPVSGCSSAGGLAVVVKIPQAELQLVTEFLVSTTPQISAAEAGEKASSKPWYGVVDGAHRLRALQILQEEDPRHFAGYRWSVLEVIWKPLHELRAFSRMRNQMQRDFVDITVFDVIVNLKAEADRILERNGETADPEISFRRELVKEICDSYCGAKSFSTDVMRNLARTAIKLSRRVIVHIGRILNSERKDLTSLRSGRTSRRRSTGDKNLKDLDGRVFRHLIKTNTFKPGSYFFSSNVTDENRIHALERLKWRAEETQNYSGVKHVELDAETERALYARQELEKLLTATGLKKAPPGMRQAVWNLLNTNKLDEDVEKCKDKEFELVPQLEDQCRRLSSVHISARIDLFKSQARKNAAIASNPPGTPQAKEVNVPNVTAETSDRDGESDREDAVGNLVVDAVNHLSRNEEISEDGPRSEFNTPDAESAESGSRESCQSPLEETRQFAYSYTWREFEVNVLTSQSAFDLILGEPVQSGADEEHATVIDAKEITDFVQFTRRSLVPGGTCFVILGGHLELYADWVRAFHESQFSTRRFYFIKNSDFVQRDVSELPQDVVELCLLARSPGPHPQGFKYNLQHDYLHVHHCTHKRKFAVIDQIPAVMSGFKLLEAPRKSPVRPGERPVALLMEVLLTFCPPNGRVLDAFAGVFTTSLACLALYPMRKISCTSLEKDIGCFKRAQERLTKAAHERVKEANRRELEQAQLQEDDELIRYDRTYVRRSERLKEMRGSSDEEGAEGVEEYDIAAPLGSAIRS